MTDLLEKLRGGDLRSIGHANEVAHEVENNPDLFGEVFNGLYAQDPVVRMRAADVIEKVTTKKPGVLFGYTAQVLSLLAASDQQEVCWHLAQIAPRLELTAAEVTRFVLLLKNHLSHKSKIVRVSAMDSLVSFAEKDASLLNEVVGIITTQMKDGSPAIQSRGQKLLKRLEKRRMGT